MQKLLISVAAFALSLTSLAEAAEIAIAPVTVSEAFEEKLKDDLGEREAEELREAVTHALTRALERKGASVVESAPVSIAVVIEDAKPNRPTFKQLGDTPGLDFIRSFGVGGAALSATITGPNGPIAAPITYSWYESDIRDAFASSTWTDARRAIGWFANRAADAYAAAPEANAP